MTTRIGQNSTPQSPPGVRALQKAAGEAASSSSTASVLSSTPGTGTDSVQISGQSILFSRLFPGQDAVSAAQVHAPGSNPDGVSICSFLTTSDRTTIASLYEYARDNGIDAGDIDKIAVDLGGYRRTPAAQRVDSVGTTFDQEGNPVTYAFSQHDEAVAVNILGSRAASDSALPRDFLEYVTDPGLTAGSHASNFDVLQKVVYATSASGAGSSRDPQAVIAPRPAERLAQMKAAGLLPTPEQVRAAAGTGSNDQVSPEDRISGIAGADQWLTANDRALLTLLHTSAADKYGSDSSNPHQLDDLASQLVKLRSAGHEVSLETLIAGQD